MAVALWQLLLLLLFEVFCCHVECAIPLLCSIHFLNITPMKNVVSLWNDECLSCHENSVCNVGLLAYIMLSKASSLKLCTVITSIDVYGFKPVSVTFTHFQGHRRVFKK